MLCLLVLFFLVEVPGDTNPSWTCVRNQTIVTVTILVRMKRPYLFLHGVAEFLPIWFWHGLMHVHCVWISGSFESH